MMFESNVSQDRLREGPSPGNVLDWVARNDAFDAITAMMTVSATLRGGDGGTPIAGVHVTRGFFDVYRRQPRLGRTFHADEFEGAASITSRQAVERRTGHRAESSPVADPGRRSADRRPDRLRGRPRLARDWRHARRLRGARRGGGLLGAVGHARVVPRRAFSERAPSRRPVPARRRPDESRDVHRRRRRRGCRRWPADWRPSIRTRTPVGVFGSSPLADEIARTSRLELLLVFAAMFCLLLLVCANVASLAIARGVARAQGDGDSPGARSRREPRHATVDRRKRVERDRHDGHRHRAHGVVGGRGPVDRARRHSAPARSGHERTSRVVRCRARARWSPLSETPFRPFAPAAHRLPARSKTGPPFRQARPAGCARDWWWPRLRLP